MENLSAKDNVDLGLSLFNDLFMLFLKNQNESYYLSNNSS